jgi:hypothetical protein
MIQLLQHSYSLNPILSNQIISILTPVVMCLEWLDWVSFSNRIYWTLKQAIRDYTFYRHYTLISVLTELLGNIFL